MKVAGVPGFEPGNGGIKTRCLTTWRHPNLKPIGRFRAAKLYAVNLSSNGESFRPCATNAS
jgi:hypothetical protein